MTNDEFKELVWSKGRELYRDMPWRRDTRPYYVVVSELMLQQTQVARVIPKFEEFIRVFPDESSLANAELSEILRLWQGLGYNRRAKYLHDIAKIITHEYNGVWTLDQASLVALPGIGKNTAGAIGAYVDNQPTLFIETNIRTVYFYHFFDGKEAVADTDIMPMLEGTLDVEHPREFYWALMDYGTWLKANGIRNVTLSHHYKKQSPLEGSVRQVRGKIVAALTSSDSLELTELQEVVGFDERFMPALTGLVRDGLVTHSGTIYHLTK